MPRFDLPDIRKPLRAVLCGLLLAATLTATDARADLAAVASSVPSAELVGKGRMTMFGFKVFDAELYAPGGTYRAADPFALKLIYLRNFKGEDITESSIKEIRRQGGATSGQLASWEKQLRLILPNVSRGQSLTGVRTSGGATDFYSGRRKLGTINDPAFTKKFFAIWLGNSTRNPRLRAKLVGAGA
ncbi:chalcone isomerase family protein [Roseibium sp.]|uniref:chalcone isomerase family protein n=1 Tax=Roseibium sp. TaxID=1936156 RepID=UPI0032676677